MAESADFRGDSTGGGDAPAADLFGAASSPAVRVEDVERRFGAGRPAGSTNKANRQVLEMVQRIGGDPRLALARIMATPIEDLRRELSCKKIEAADFWLRVVRELLPYVASKQPLAVAISGKVAQFNITVPTPAGAAIGPGAILDMLAATAAEEIAAGFDPHAGGQVERLPAPLESDGESDA